MDTPASRPHYAYALRLTVLALLACLLAAPLLRHIAENPPAAQAAPEGVAAADRSSEPRPAVAPGLGEASGELQLQPPSILDSPVDWVGFHAAALRIFVLNLAIFLTVVALLIVFARRWGSHPVDTMI